MKNLLFILFMLLSFNSFSQTVAVKIGFKASTRLVDQPKKSMNRVIDGFQIIEDSCTGILFKTKKGNYAIDVSTIKQSLDPNKTYKIYFYLKNRELRWRFI